MSEMKTPARMLSMRNVISAVSFAAILIVSAITINQLPGQSNIQAAAAQVSIPRMPPAPIAATPNNILAKRAVRECQFISDGKLLITTTSGVLFEVGVRNVTVANHDPRLDGTYVDIDLGRPDVVIVNGLSYYASNAIIRVRTEKDYTAWLDALDKVRTKFYAPRDVAPPPVR